MEAQSPEEDSLLAAVIDPVASDPLSEVTRAERRSLLLFSLVGVTIAKAGLIPGGVPALAIELKPSDRLTLLYVIVVVLLYYLIAFSIYSRSDLKRRDALLAHRNAPANAYLARLRDRVADLKDPGRLERVSDEIARPAEFRRIAKELEKFSNARVLFDCHVPVVVGGIAIVTILAETRGFAGWFFRTSVFSVVFVGFLALYLWKNRQGLAGFLRDQECRIHRWRMWRMIRKSKTLPEDSPRRRQLLERAASLYSKAFWVPE